MEVYWIGVFFSLGYDGADSSYEAGRYFDFPTIIHPTHPPRGSPSFPTHPTICMALRWGSECIGVVAEARGAVLYIQATSFGGLCRGQIVGSMVVPLYFISVVV